MVWVSAVFAAVGDAMLLHGDTLTALGGPRRQLEIAAGVALVAGLSTILGHIVVFLVNRVRGIRLVIAMLLGAVFFTLLHVLSALLAWGAAAAITRSAVPFEPVLIAYLFSVAPLALGFLEVIPHFGILIGKILTGWSVVCLWFLASALLGVGTWTGLVIALAAWLLVLVASRVLANPLAATVGRLWTMASGKDYYITAHDILAGAPFIPLSLGRPAPGRREAP